MENSSRGIQLQLDEFSVIGDIGGEFHALKRLASRLSGRIILAGDLPDRGENSKEVIEWAMNNPNVIALMGNHEHLMLDWYDKTGIYEPGIWFGNGGVQTLESYTKLYPGKPSLHEKIREEIPKEHIDWLRARPMYALVNGALQDIGWEEGCLISHAPLHPNLDLHRAAECGEDWSLELGLLWNRKEPIKREFFQVFGHNAHWGCKPFADGLNTWGYCLDSSWSKKLTAMTFPSGLITEEPFEIGQPESYRGRLLE